jgi:hypothetical protein
MITRLTALGGTVDPAGLDVLVEAFRRTGTVRAGLVLPFDRPAAAEDLGNDPSSTTTGVLWTDEAECRWRIEGGRAIVTVIAEGSSGSLEADAGELTVERLEVTAHDSVEPVAWMRAPFIIGGGGARFIERTYRLEDGGPVHRRLHVITAERSDAA